MRARRGDGVKLDGARCLVVGGARRLGRVIALDLAAHGADLAVSSRSAHGDAAATCAAIRGLGRRGVAVTGDPAAPAEAAALVTAAADALGGLDVLVYAAAGPFRPAAPQDIDLGDWQASFDVVARGFFVAARTARGLFVSPDARQNGAASAGAAEEPAPSAAPSTAGRAATTRGVIVALTDVLGAAPAAAFAGARRRQGRPDRARGLAGQGVGGRRGARLRRGARARRPARRPAPRGDPEGRGARRHRPAGGAGRRRARRCGS